jgi:hypothetical protein
MGYICNPNPGNLPTVFILLIFFLTNIPLGAEANQTLALIPPTPPTPHYGCHPQIPSETIGHARLRCYSRTIRSNWFYGDTRR